MTLAPTPNNRQDLPVVSSSSNSHWKTNVQIGMASKYDILIVGGGPAGLSAAASIVRHDHKTVLLYLGKYRNAESKHMHTVSSWDHRDPAEFRRASLAGLERYGSITVENVKIETLKQKDAGTFEAFGAGKAWTGKKVILAAGVEDVFLDIAGCAECWISAM